MHACRAKFSGLERTPPCAFSEVAPPAGDSQKVLSFLDLSSFPLSSLWAPLPNRPLLGFSRLLDIFESQARISCLKKILLSSLDDEMGADDQGLELARGRRKYVGGATSKLDECWGEEKQHPRAPLRASISHPRLKVLRMYCVFTKSVFGQKTPGLTDLVSYPEPHHNSSWKHVHIMCRHGLPR